jgi:hypothetical protein
MKAKIYKSEFDPYCKGKITWIIGRGHGCNGKKGNIHEEGHLASKHPLNITF